jgi:trimethylamine:corrinoid methyltransferase-like protein
VDRLKSRAVKAKVEENTVNSDPEKCIKNYSKYLVDNIRIDPVNPRSMMKLDEDMGEAMKKMERVKELMNCLPEVDCCICGAPSCLSFAEDIVQEKAEIGQCIFVQRALEKAGRYDSYVSIKKMKEIWGEKKFDRKC